MPYKKESVDTMTRPSWMEAHPVEHIQLKADSMIERIALKYLKRIHSLVSRGRRKMDKDGNLVWEAPGARELAEARECLKLAKVDLANIKRVADSDDAEGIREEIRLRLANDDAGTEPKKQSAVGG